MFGAAVLLAACGASASDDEPGAATPASGGDAATDLVITRDVAVADVTTADVFAPRGAHDVPVVVMFHGTEGRRSKMEPLAVDVAGSGAVVVVPSWPVIAERPPADTTDDVYFDQTAAAVCSVRFAHATAAEHGGDPADLTVVGHSGGAPLVARVALVDEPPWPGIDCYPGVSSHVDRLVGTGGDFHNEYQFSSWIRDVHRPYDVFGLDVTNLDLEVRLLHGGADSSVWVGSSTDFDAHLDALGLDSEVVYADTGHGELIDPTTPGGRLVADEIGALIHGSTSIFDEAEAGATMTFDGARCSHDGTVQTELGRPLRIRLATDSEAPVWFSMVGFGPGVSDDDMAAILAAGPLPIDEPPANAEAANFVSVEPGSEGEMTWVFVHGSLRWVSYCMPNPESTDLPVGMMYPASEVVVGS